VHKDTGVAPLLPNQTNVRFPFSTKGASKFCLFLSEASVSWLCEFVCVCVQAVRFVCECLFLQQRIRVSSC
jgi:hypothetical protein